MQWITWILFESLPALGVCLFLLNFATLVFWRRGGSPRPLLVTLLLAAVLLPTQALVTTQGEHARDILRRIERDLLAGRTAAFEASLAPSFRAAGMERDDFIDFARRRMESLRIHLLQRLGGRVESSSEDRFVYQVSYASTISTEPLSGTINSTWRVTFVRVDGAWRIGMLDTPTIQGRKITRWAEIER